MKSILPIVLFVFLVLSGCNEATPKKERNFPSESAILGLATPVQLNKETTKINLNDFFLNPDSIDSVSVSMGLSAEKEGSILTVSGTPVNALGELKCWVSGIEYAILLKCYGKKTTTFQFDPEGKAYETVKVKGTLNDWNPDNNPLKLKEGIWQTELTLYPGAYQYQIVADNVDMLDPGNPDKISNGQGGFNSLLKVEAAVEEDLPALTIDWAQDKFHISVDRPYQEVYVLLDNYRLSFNDFLVQAKAGGFTIAIPPAFAEKERSFLRVWSANAAGRSADILIPLEKGKAVVSANQLGREDKEASVLYFMLVDRFFNGNTENDAPLNDPRVDPRADYQGGDIAGILAKLKEGYFDDLNINTIWLSPITQNPTTAYQEYPAPHRFYSGYHGYWPITFTTIDTRFGTDDELHALVDEAHKRDMNVILDFVSNHVHEENPFYKEHPEWATQLDLENGRKNIRLWDEERLTTWFDTFLPSLDFAQPEVTDILSDSALYWIEQFNLDGYRHDATKHIPLDFWRTLTRKLKERVVAKRNQRVYQIGETFGSRELIGSYVGSGLLDGQFDFNLYFDAVSVFADSTTSFENLAGSLRSTFNFYGHHHMMGNITGNHDLTRFITLAGDGFKPGEDHKETSWHREIKVENLQGYDRLKQLSAFVLTIPGVPVVFYGDDIGMVGGNDPDNRRMMRFENLNDREEGVKSNLQKLTELRRSRMSLLYGDFNVLSVSDQHLIYARSYLGETTIVAFNKSNQAATLTIDLPEGVEKATLATQFGHSLEGEGSAQSLQLNPNSFEVICSK